MVQLNSCGFFSDKMYVKRSLNTLTQLSYLAPLQ